MPKFSIEKPLGISINSPLVDDMSKSGYIAQLKIDEYRSFFIIERNMLTVLGWRGNVHHTETLGRVYDNMVLDGGIIKTKTFLKRPLYYVFDILLEDGTKMREGYIDRYNKLCNLGLSPAFSIPENTTNIRSEYNLILNKKSTLVDNFAQRAEVSINTAYEACEGLVIKKVDGLLKYPNNVYHGPNQLKLKLPGR